MLKEPEKMRVPSRSDFDYDGDVDENWAIDVYLDKDIDFAEKRYYTLDPLSVVQDFTLVGPKAFRYYIFGAFRYLQSYRAEGEQDVYAYLPGILEKKISENPSAFIFMASYLVEFTDWAIANYSKFDIDVYKDIYGDVRSRYKAVNEKAKELSKL